MFVCQQVASCQGRLSSSDDLKTVSLIKVYQSVSRDLLVPFLCGSFVTGSIGVDLLIDILEINIRYTYLVAWPLLSQNETVNSTQRMQLK